MVPESGSGRDATLVRLLEVIENDIVPLTRSGVASGNKIFGAAILRKSDLSVVIAATNNETANPPLARRDPYDQQVLRIAVAPGTARLPFLVHP